MTNRTTFITTALSFMGASESDGSHKEIIDIYNSIVPLPRGYRLSYSDPWCAAFVSAVGERAGFKQVLPECSCDAMIALYQAKGQYFETDFEPQAGDLVFYDWDASGTADHVGIIAEAGSVLKVIEGNVSDRVDHRLLTRNSTYIKGYASPFVGAGIARPLNPLPSRSADDQWSPLQNTVDIAIPQLSHGSTGNSVRALQHLLIGNGHSCGTYGADGEFGAKTRDALIGFQKRSGLDPDAIAGKQTWTKLLL